MKARSILVAVCVLIGFCSNRALAQPVKRQQFEEHTVKKGETPYTIAEHFHVKKKDFLILNDFPEDIKLQPGQIVLIRPLAEGEKASEETRLSSNTNKSSSSYGNDNSGSTKKSYESTNSSKSTYTEKSAPPPSNKPVEVGPGGTHYKVSESGYHVVERGQTFYRIALIYGLTVDQLKELNHLTNTNVEVGQKLRVK